MIYLLGFQFTELFKLLYYTLVFLYAILLMNTYKANHLLFFSRREANHLCYRDLKRVCIFGLFFISFFFVLPVASEIFSCIKYLLLRVLITVVQYAGTLSFSWWIFEDWGSKMCNSFRGCKRLILQLKFCEVIYKLYKLHMLIYWPWPRSWSINYHVHSGVSFFKFKRWF